MKNFDELELLEPIRAALADRKYTTPTPVQAGTIPAAVTGRDILGAAQTGTGKTAAFAIPVLQRLGTKPRKSVPNRPFALVLAPTRELAIQIGDSFREYGAHLKLRTTLVYGGVSQGKQVRALSRGTHILVATPGRLLDLMNHGHIELSSLSVFVLDEADRMLDMGFLPDVRRIIGQLPRRRQSLFFSATMSPAIVRLAAELMADPVRVDVRPRTVTELPIQQRVIRVPQRRKPALLLETVSDTAVESAVVFTRTKREANSVSAQLVRAGVTAAAIHGNKSQNARQRALDGFRGRRIRVLVATDIAARGIDVSGVTHVVNYDLPVEPENYVHRIGRTARAGATGVAISFCSPREESDLRSIEKLLKRSIPCEQIDSGEAPVRVRQNRTGGGESPGRASATRKPRRRRRRRSKARQKQAG